MAPQTLKKASLLIDGMHCAGCASSVEKALQNTEGVQQASVNIATEQAAISYDAQQTSESQLEQAVEKAGYRVHHPEKDHAVQTVTIDGMHCAGCVQAVQHALAGIEGVAKAQVNLATETAQLEFSNGPVGRAAIAQAVADVGYTLAEDVDAGANKADARREREAQKLQTAKRRMWWAWALTIPLMIWMLPEMMAGYAIGGELFYQAGMVVLSVIIIFGPGVETMRGAWLSAKNGHPNMDVLIAMGALAALSTGGVALLHQLRWAPAFHSFAGIAGMIMAFHLTGRYIETKAKGRASEAIRQLMTLGAKKATVKRENGEVEISINQLQPGDMMVIRPGEKIPTDGTIIDGESTVDESIATGESMPVKKTSGDTVIGATINKNGLLHVKATSVGEDTFLSQIIRMVEEAQGSKVPIQETADRITAVFVPAILGLAVATLGLWLLFPSFFGGIAGWASAYLPWIQPGMGEVALAFYAAIAVLVIACPCALGLATPTALMVGSGLGAENGILIRKGAAIQAMKDIDHIVLDKTGTITKGEPSVTDVAALNNVEESRVIRLAGGAESGSEHPLGKAVNDYARQKMGDVPTPTHFEAIPGKGIRAEVEGRSILIGNRSLMQDEAVETGPAQQQWQVFEADAKTAMAVAVDRQLAGLIAVADPVKEDSTAAITSLQAMGLQPIMITGDNERTAKAIARQVGIENVIAGVLPNQKSAEIKKLQKQGYNVAMVGDGINDAPALAQANVGIAIGTGTDVAIEAGDIVLVRGSLQAAVKAVRLSRATFRKIKQNLFWAFFYNVVMVPFAMLGMLHPLLAEAAMALSSINVVSNSRRLRSKKLDA